MRLAIACASILQCAPVVFTSEVRTISIYAHTDNFKRVFYFIHCFNVCVLTDAAAEAKFRELVQLFCGTQSYHNFISMKGRELRRTRTEVSIVHQQSAAT
jgi:tRNA U38,U39,U40 pseudouridine synthase TruA